MHCPSCTKTVKHVFSRAFKEDIELIHALLLHTECFWVVFKETFHRSNLRCWILELPVERRGVIVQATNLPTLFFPRRYCLCFNRPIFAEYTKFLKPCKRCDPRAWGKKATKRRKSLQQWIPGIQDIHVRILLKILEYKVILNWHLPIMWDFPQSLELLNKNYW